MTKKPAVIITHVSTVSSSSIFILSFWLIMPIFSFFPFLSDWIIQICANELFSFFSSGSGNWKWPCMTPSITQAKLQWMCSPDQSNDTGWLLGFVNRGCMTLPIHNICTSLEESECYDPYSRFYKAIFKYFWKNKTNHVHSSVLGQGPALHRAVV